VSVAATHVVNDVSGLNPVPVWAVVTPKTVEEVAQALARTDGPVSIGGGRYSMGGQVASPGSLHIDLRGLNQVIAFSPMARTIRVQAGIRWRDIQRFIDPHELSVKIMQTYSNFTVGGSLSVNVHGRYMGLGPLILATRAIRLVLADGTIADASPQQNPELFYGAIGGYGGLGVIVEAELDLVPNAKVERLARKLSRAQYDEHFRSRVFVRQAAVFHNADLYPPHFERVRSVTWVETDKPVTEQARLQLPGQSYPLHRYFIWAISETPFGKWRREHLIDPLIYARGKVHWRNFEASYDVAELEPSSRQHTTYVLQEYFVPVERFDEFVPKMAEILQRHRVNALNVSVRHAVADPGSLLAWAKGETFAFVLYYKQRTRDNARNRVAVWTRELIDAAINVGGAYYLPYQAHATRAQFHAAYPRAHELFALKRRIDPSFRLRNVIWDTYYAPTLEPAAVDVASPEPASEFRAVFGDTALRDAFYRFLQNIYRLYPEDRFHTLIRDLAEQHDSDEAIYRNLLRLLPPLKPALGDLRLALPALARQKREMAAQTLQAVGEQRVFDGYLEIGTTGRYLGALARHLRLRGPQVLVNDVAPGFSPVDIVERGRLLRRGRFEPLGNYQPIASPHLAAASFDLITCYIGLHHAPPSALDGFVRSIARLLRPGGRFVLRDHDVTTPSMRAFVSLAHTVFNAGLGVPWETNQAELRHFAPVDTWVERLRAHGLEDTGVRLRQALDPSDNVLMAFAKPSGSLA
jgi:FAD/FMN-containing dehydrogenase/SAM-dependent methyltransferase